MQEQGNRKFRDEVLVSCLLLFLFLVLLLMMMMLLVLCIFLGGGFSHELFESHEVAFLLRIAFGL